MKRTITILFALLSMTVLGSSVSLGATWYGIYVGETRVTDENATDILGDGQFKYDASTKTLTVSNATLNNTGSLGSGISNREVDGLVIRLVGSSTFTTRMSVLSSSKSLTITGSGSLTGTSSSTSAFQLGGDGSTCTIDGPTLAFATTSTAAVFRDYNSTYTLQLTGRGTRLTLTPLSGYVAMSGLKGLTLGDGMYLTEPEDGFFSSTVKSVTTDGTTAYRGRVVFSDTPRSYGLFVDGIEVTEANAADIFDNGGSSSYDPSSKTLTMKNGGFINTDRLSALGSIATIRGAGIVNNAVDGLVVNVDGEVLMSCLYAIVSLKSITFTGSGTLYGQFVKDENNYEKLFEPAGILLLGEGITCTIDGPKLVIQGNYGSGPAIADPSQSATVRIEGTSTLVDLTPGYGYAAIEGLGNLHIGTGLAINAPAGGYFDSTLKSVTTDGTTPYQGNVTIGKPEEYGIYVAETMVTSANAADILGDGAFSYDPEHTTLTVADAQLYNNGTLGSGISNREVDGLVIRLVGSSTFSTRMSVIESAKDFSISGGGSLSGTSSNFNGLYLSADRVVCSVEDVTLNLTGGQSGLRDLKQNGTLIVSGDDTSITLNTGTPSRPTIDGLFSLQLGDGLHLTEPYGGYFDSTLKSVTTDGTTAYRGTIVISSKQAAAEEYGLTVAGISVTAENAADILGDGRMRYAADKKMLTLENVTLNLKDCCALVNDDVEGLTIRVNGKNSIIVDSEDSDNIVGIINHQPMRITGYGILDITSKGKSFGVSSSAPVTIDGPRMTCKSEQLAWLSGVLSAEGELSVQGAYTQLTLTSGEHFPPIFMLKSFTLGEDLFITQPYGGYYDGALHGFTTDGATRYEGTFVVSNTPAQAPAMAGDVTGDGVVDIADIARMISIIGNKKEK